MKYELPKKFILENKDCYKKSTIKKLLSLTEKDPVPIIDILNHNKIPVHHKFSFVIKFCDVDRHEVIEIVTDGLRQSIVLNNRSELFSTYSWLYETVCSNIHTEISKTIDSTIESFEHDTDFLSSALRLYAIAIKEYHFNEMGLRHFAEAVGGVVSRINRATIKDPKIIENLDNALKEIFLKKVDK